MPDVFLAKIPPSRYPWRSVRCFGSGQNRFLAGLGAAAALTTAGIGAFHAGVEQKWWDGPSSCTGDGAGLSGLSGQDLLATDTLEKLVMCDEISWSFVGLSMPAWNAVFSALLCAIWITALRR